MVWRRSRDPAGQCLRAGAAGKRTHRHRAWRAAMSEAPAMVLAPPAFLGEPALAAVLSALPEARVVGGAVRDTLASRPVTEVDLATPRTPEEVMEVLRA